MKNSIKPPPSGRDIEKMALDVILSQKAFKRACDATEAARKAMAQAHQELETAREALHGWLDELPMVFEGFVFTKGDEELRIARIHTPQSLAKEIESKWCPEGE